MVGVLTARPHTPQLCLSHPSDAMFPRMENTTIFIPEKKDLQNLNKVMGAIYFKTLITRFYYTI